MIIRGTVHDMQANRAGHLSEAQKERLSSLKPFQLAVLPVALAGLVFILFGINRGDGLGWVVAGLGLFMVLSGVLRYRQRKSLSSGQVDSFIGTLEKVRSSPLKMFEAEIIVDGTSYVVMSGNSGQHTLEPGQRYRYFVMRGLARMGIIVGIELP